MTSSHFARFLVLAGVSALLLIGSQVTPTFASTDSDTAREQAENILKNDKYQDKKDQPLQDDAQRLTRWLGAKKSKPAQSRSDEQIREQSSRRRDPSFTPPGAEGIGPLAYGVLIVIAVIIVAGIIYLIAKAFMNRDKTKITKKQFDAMDISDIDWSDEEKILEEISDADLLDRLSLEAQNAGHLDIALRYRFRAGLLRLNDKKIITFHPSITNAQWQLILNNTKFDDLTRDFNDVTYGKIPCDEVTLSRARDTWPIVLSAPGKETHND